MERSFERLCGSRAHHAPDGLCQPPRTLSERSFKILGQLLAEQYVPENVCNSHSGNCSADSTVEPRVHQQQVIDFSLSGPRLSRTRLSDDANLGTSAIPKFLCAVRSVSCGVAATAGLATYAFPPQTPRVFHWFEDCIEQIVKHLDEAPFLQLVYPDRKSAFERHQVNASIVAVPQVS